jgi:hypothetical protein
MAVIVIRQPIEDGRVYLDVNGFRQLIGEPVHSPLEHGGHVSGTLKDVHTGHDGQRDVLVFLIDVPGLEFAGQE